MNKNIIIALIAGGALLLGGAGYLVYDNLISKPLASVEIIDGQPVLSGKAVHYPATIAGTITDTANPINNGIVTIAMQDETTWSMEFTSEEGAMRIIYSATGNYIHNPGDDTWIKFPVAHVINSPLDGISLSPADFDEYQRQAVFKGKQSCHLGQCDTWEWTNPEKPGEKTTIMLGPNGRVAETTFISGTSTVHLVYDYSAPVNIEIPANAVELDIPVEIPTDADLNIPGMP